jgi:hypothetical protein
MSEVCELAVVWGGDVGLEALKRGPFPRGKGMSTMHSAYS